MRRVPPTGLATLSGVLLALSFPKFGHWSVAWVALAPLLLALAAADGRRGFRLGYLTGLVSGVGLLYWTALVVVQYGGLGRPLGLVLMLLLALAVALFAGLFGWLVGVWLRRFGSGALLLSPVAWVATEILRSHMLYRFPWCLLGYSQQPNLPFIQIASVTAVYGVSFLVAGASAVLAYSLVEPRSRRRLAALVVLCLSLAATGLHGLHALAQPEAATAHLRVGLVQARILQDEKWDPARALENVEQHLGLTREAAARGARLVVWPESAVPFDVDAEPALTQELRGVAAGKSLYLLFGNDDHEAVPGAAPRVYVGVKLLTPEGELSYRYHKIRLVPFGEYTPLQPLLTLGGRYAARLVQEVGDFTPGHEARVGSLDGARFGAFICYEAIFPDLIRQFTAGGAELLVNMTNDAWYGTSSAPDQHFAMAAFRAVENGRYLVRAANTGISAVVDSKGRVLERSELFARAVLVRDVPLLSASTFYGRHGDVFAWSCFAAATLLTLAAVRRS